MDNKRNLGQFFTKDEKWLFPQVVSFIQDSIDSIKENTTKDAIFLDPYAGDGDMLNAVHKLFPKNKIEGLDIDNPKWPKNDSLISYKYDQNTFIITNPPYLAKNSATRQKLPSAKYFKDNECQDLYQIALDLATETYSRDGVFIIPASYVQAETNPLINSVTFVSDDLFEDTKVPICIVCIRQRNEKRGGDYDIYQDSKKIGTYWKFKNAENKLFKHNISEQEIIFNPKENDGDIWLRAIDNQLPDQKIEFFDKDKYSRKTKVSDRAICSIKLSYLKDKNNAFKSAFITELNKYLNEYRKATKDFFLTSFRGKSSDGTQRRRISFDQVRKIINNVIAKLESPKK